MGKKFKSSLDSLINNEIQQGQVDPQTGLEQVKPPKGKNLDQIIAENSDSSLKIDMSRSVGTERQATGLTEEKWDFSDHAAAYKRRAVEQPWYEQTGNSMARFVPKIALGIVEQAGYLFDLNAHVDTVTGAGNDYSNFLTEFAQSGKSALDEAFPVYRENPNSTFDLGDWAWWVDNGEGLVTSIGEFMATGYGVGKMFGTGAKLLAQTMKNSARAAGILGGTAEILTAAELAYVEGAMGGAEVYKEIFDLAMSKGKTFQEANEQAGKAAATTVRMNTLINTGLNATSAKMFVRPMGAAKRLDDAFLRMPGESKAAWRARLAAGSSTNKTFASTASEMGQESLEEIVNELSTAVGTFKGRQALHDLKPEDDWSISEVIMSTLGKDSTALAAILGAVGGGGQKFIASKTPNAKKRAELENNYQKQQLEYVLQRLDSFQEAQKKIAEGAKTGNKKLYTEGVNQAFNTEAFASIINGTEEHLATLYQEIEKMDQQEAENAGYDVSDGPDNYKKRARKAQEDLRRLSKDYENIINRYNSFDDEAASVGYAQEVFARHVQKNNMESAIDRAQEMLNKEEADHAKQLERRGTDLGVSEAIGIQNNMKAIHIAMEQTNQEVSDVMKMDARGKLGKNALVTRYGAPAKGTSRKQHALNMIEKRVGRMIKQYDNLKKQLDKSREDFKAAGNKVSDFETELQNTTVERESIAAAQAEIIGAREILKELDNEYNKFTSKEGRDEYVKRKQSERDTERTNERKNEKTADKEAATEQDRINREEARIKAEQEAAAQATETPAEGNNPPVDAEPVKDDTGETESVPSEPEVDKAVTDAGLAASDATRPKPPIEDGEVENASKAQIEKASEVKESESTSERLVVPAGASFAYLSKEYSIVNGEKRTTGNKKNDDLIKELESASKFLPKTKLVLELDRNAVWQDDQGVTRSFNDYVKADGTYDVGNVPIAIKHNDEIVAYMRTNDWITATKDGVYANVANSLDPSSPVYKNAEKQAAINMAIRESVVKHGAVTTEVKSKGVGTLSKNIVDKKVTKDTMAKLTPKQDTLIIVKNGQLHINKDDQYVDKSLINTTEFLENLFSYEGLVMAPFPTPNGSVMISPLSIPTLTGPQIDTILSVLYSPGAFAEQIFEDTGYDVETNSGMLSFLRMFTHVSDMSEKEFKEKVDGDGPASKMHLNFSTKTGKISFAKHNRAITTIDKKDAFATSDQLREILAGKLLSIRLSAINTSGNVVEPRITDNAYESIGYDNYNEFAKSYLQTDIRANEINEKEDSYFDQPVIEFDQKVVPLTEKTEQVAEVTPVVDTTETNPEEQPLATEPEPESDDNLLSNIDEILGLDMMFDSNLEYVKSETLEVDEASYDFNMTEEKREMLKKGLEKMLVRDKGTGELYNAAQQSQVIGSIMELVVRGLQSKLSLPDSFKAAKDMFATRENLYKAAERKFNELTDAQKEKLAIKDLSDAQMFADEFSKVNNNWADFQKHTKQELANVFGLKKTLSDTKEQSIDSTLEGFEELESFLEKVNFDDGAAFETNHKDTASARFKLFLALQEAPQRTFLNLRSFMKFDTVYDDIQMILAGVDPNYDSFISELTISSANKPYLKNIIDSLDRQTQQIKNEFVTAFSKQYNPHIVTLWGSKETDNGLVLQMDNIESNRNDVIKRFEAEWIENQKSSPIVRSSRGVLMIDAKKAQLFEDIRKKAEDSPTVENADTLLKMIGINMPAGALDHLFKESDKILKMSPKGMFKSGMFKHMSNALNAGTVDGDADSQLSLNNPLTGVNKEGSSVRTLASIASKFTDSVYSNSHKDSAGKTIYSYSLHTHLSHTMRKLKENSGKNATTEGLSKISFSKYSDWLRRLQTDSKFADTFSVSYLDGLNKRYSNQKGVKRGRQSEREMELQSIALFQNNGNASAHFVYPTISDKSTTPLITALKHQLEVRFTDDGKLTFGKNTKTAIHNLVRAEIDRIENHKTTSPEEGGIMGYDFDKKGNVNKAGAKRFLLFPQLNDMIEFTNDGKIHSSVQEKMFKAVEDHIKELALDTLSTWKDLGIVTEENVMFDASYRSTLAAKVGGNIAKQAVYAALDMELNYMIANINVMQLISGDPALHYKNDEETTMVEYTKRLAKDIAPGMDGNFRKPDYNVVFLKDKKSTSQHIDNYKKVIKDKYKSYEDMEGTDAQELTTVQEHLEVMYSYGKLSDEQFKELMDKADKEQDFNGKELDVILQPMKPVFVGNQFNFERDVNKITYIKSSSFPLLPQFTKGLEIDALRKEMLSNKVDRAAYVTATKLGATNVATIWDGNKLVDGFSLKGKVNTLSRNGFRIQQEVPYKEDKKKILTISQMNKLLFEGILEIKGMPELKARKEEIRIKLFEMGKEELFDKLGVVVDPSTGDFRFHDLKKVKNALVQEAKSRNYPINDIQALELTEDKQSFILPLGFNASSKKLESVLMSIVSNTIIKQKLPGKSYVQGSSAGVLTGANKSKTWSELTDSELGGIVFTNNANLDEGLKFVRRNEDTGKTEAAQLIVPFYFRDANGKPLKMSDYTKKVGKKTILDPDKVDSELLKLIGARIPNQGHSSMLPIEIVGFLPESMGDLVIVPDEITAQMGSDFDVDKLYVYQYNYEIKDDGSIAKLTEAFETVTKTVTKEVTKQVEVSDTTPDYSTMPDIQGNGFTFNPQQKEAYYKIKDWAEKDAGGTFTLEGYAGTGKTTIVEQLINQIFVGESTGDPFETAGGLGWTVGVSAPTHKAKTVIADSTNKPAETIHRLLGLAPDMELETFDPENLKLDPKRKPAIGDYDIIVLDEASMLSADLYDYLTKIAKETGTKILFMGDPAQLPPVGEEISKVFAEATNKYTLTKVERQTGGNPLGPIYDAIRSNLESPADMFKHETNLTDKQEGIEVRTPLETSQVLDEAAENFKNDAENTKVLAWTNAKVKVYNTEIRKRLKPEAKDYIEEGDILMGYSSIGVNPITGDPLIENGKDVVVEETHTRTISGISVFGVKLKDTEGSIYILNPTAENIRAYAKEVNALKQTALKAVDKRARGAAWAAYYNFVNTISTPVDIDINGRRLKSKDIDYGYAVTVHKSQGSTYNNVYIDEVDIDRNQKVKERNSLKYVAMSRPRVKATLISNKDVNTPVGKAVKQKPVEQAPLVKEPRYETVTETVTEEVQELVPSESKAALQNEYIDIHWKVLTHPEVLDRVLSPLDKRGEYSVDGEASKIHGIRSKNAKTRSPLYRRVQTEAFMQNRGGKSGVGIFSLASTFNATIQSENLRLGEMIDGEEQPIFIDVFEGYSLHRLSGKGNNSKGDKASVIQDMQNASVDNAKEQTLDKLNLNDTTFAAANAMAQLETVEGKNLHIQYISRLLSQKIVLDYVKEYAKLADSTIEGEAMKQEDRKQLAANNVIDKYTEDSKKASATITKLNPENMLSMIEKEASPSNSWYADQIVALKAFMEFDEIGTTLTNIQSALNTDSKGVSPTYYQVEDKLFKIQNIANNPKVRGATALFSPSKEAGRATELGPVLAKKITAKFLPQGSVTMQTTTDVVMQFSGKDQLTADQRQKIFDDFKAYVFASESMFNVDPQTERRRLLIGTKDNESLATRVKNAQKTEWGASNFLLMRLAPKFAETAGSGDLVSYIASAGERMDESESTKAFVDLLTSKDDEQRLLGEDLVKYSYLTSGVQGANNFMKFVPTVYLEAMGISEQLRNFNWNTSEGNHAVDFARQFIRNNPYFATQMSNPVENLIKGNSIVIDTNLDNLTNPFLDYVTFDKNGNPTFVEFLQRRVKNEYELYQYDRASESYVKVETLGHKGGLLEYSSTGAVIGSSFSNKPSSGINAIKLSNKNAFTSIQAEYDMVRSTDKGKEMTKKTLRKIAANSTNPSNRYLAKVLGTIHETLPEFNFEIDNSVSAAGSFGLHYAHDVATGQLISYSENMVMNLSAKKFVNTTDNTFNRERFEETFMHELVHGHTSSFIKAYQVDPASVPSSIRKAIKSLEATRRIAINSLSDSMKAHLKEIDALTGSDAISKYIKDNNLTTDQGRILYGLSNSTGYDMSVEYITHIMTNPVFQEFLNNITFEGEKSVFDRILDILSNFLAAIGDALGIEVKQNSLLREALSSGFELLSEGQRKGEHAKNQASLAVVLHSIKNPKKGGSQSNSDIEITSRGKKILTNDSLRFMRKEFGLLNADGKPKRLTLAQANTKVENLKTKNERFMTEFGDIYNPYVTLAPTSRKTYYNVGFGVKEQRVSNDDLDSIDSTVDPSIEKIIDRIESRIKSLKRAMSEDNSKKVEYQDKIDKLEEEIEKLEEENSLKALSEVADAHLSWVANILDKKTIGTRELKDAENAINVWRDIKKLFKDDYSGKFKETISNISSRAEDLETLLLDVAQQVLLKELNYTSVEQAKLEELKVMQDAGVARAKMFDLSRSGTNAVTRTLSTWLQNAARDAGYEFQQFSTELKEQYKKLKESPEYKANGFDIFLQKKDGEWTGGLTNRYSQDYYDEYKAQIKKRDREKGKSDSWKKFFAWERKNKVMVDTRLLFEEDGSRKADHLAEAHIKSLEDEFGKDRAEEMVSQAEDKFMKYLSDKQAFEESLEARMEIDDSFNQPEYDNALRLWTLENSPKSYINKYFGQAIVKGVKMRGYQYTVSKPRKIVDGKPTKWYDENYEKIERDETLMDFYNYYRSAMAQSLSYLPTYEIKDLQANFIPNVKKTLIERFTDNGMKGAVTGLYENFVEAISTAERGSVSSDRDMRTGNVNKRIPVRFLNESEVEDKSTDLIKGLEMFQMMALNYKHKSKIEDKVLLTQRLINEALEQKVTAAGQIQKDTSGSLYKVTDGNVNIKNAVKDTIDAMLYDERRNEGAPTGIVLAKTIKETKEASKLAHQIQKLNRQYQLGKISSLEHTTKTEPLQKRLDEIGGRNITTADVADVTMRITQLKGMAFNIFSASNNISFGLISNIIHAAGGEDFSIKDATKAYRIMLASTSKSLGLDRGGLGEGTSKKIRNLMTKMDVLFEVNESAYSKTSKAKGDTLWSKLSPYELQKRSEYFVQGMNMVATMLNEKVTKLDGTKTSLFEAFDENGNWKEDEYGENKQWAGDISSEEEMVQFRRFRNKLIQLNKRVHGNYDPNSFVPVKKAIFGRFALQFRSWFAEAVALRFEPETWDDQLGRNVKGMYRTIGQIGPMKTLQAFFKIATMKKNGLSEFSEVDQANLRKSFTELSFILGLLVAGLTVAQLGDDDDDDKTARNILVNQINRLQSDLTFFLSPSSFDQILSNPVPAIRTYLDAERAIKSVGQYVMQDEELDGRKKLESEDVWLKILKAFPYLNQIPKAKTQAEKVY